MREVFLQNCRCRVDDIDRLILTTKRNPQSTHRRIIDPAFQQRDSLPFAPGSQFAFEKIIFSLPGDRFNHPGFDLWIFGQQFSGSTAIKNKRKIRFIHAYSVGGKDQRNCFCAHQIASFQQGTGQVLRLLLDGRHKLVSPLPHQAGLGKKKGS